jgi:ectoine hydroxylase-related dioxygenase (phytanoyl-CoA dioxygenase family)
MGLLQVVPGSHKEGLIKFKASGKQNPFVSAKEFSDSSFIDVSVGDNQILVFSQMLMHRSGVNHSEKTRLTLQARFNDLECMEEMTTSFTPAHSKFTIRAQSKILEETKDL